MACLMDLMNSPHNILLWTREMAQWVKSWPEKPDKFDPPNPLWLDKVAQASVTTLNPYWDRGIGHWRITRSPQASQLSEQVVNKRDPVSNRVEGEDQHPGLSSDLQTCTKRGACIPTLTYANCFIVVYICMCIQTYLYTHTYMVVFTILTIFNLQFSGMKSCWLLKDIPSGFCFGIISATVGSWHILGCSLQMYKHATDLVINLLSCISDELA